MRNNGHKAKDEEYTILQRQEDNHFRFLGMKVERWRNGYKALDLVVGSIPIYSSNSCSLGKLFTYMCLCHQAV